MKTIAPLQSPTCVGQPRTSRIAFSLFEVLLALFILAVGVTSISQLMQIGSQSAVLTEVRAEAARRAESTLDAILCGLLPMVSTQETPFEDDEEWIWSANVEPASLSTVLVVTVEVTSPSGRLGGIQRYQLSTLVRDPDQLPIDESALINEFESLEELE